MDTRKYFLKTLRFFKKATLKFEKVYFFKIDLKTFCFDLERGDIKISNVNDVQDLKDIISERGGSYVHRYEKWLKRKYLCYRAILDNKVIGILWLNNTSFVEVLFGYKEKIQNCSTEAWVIDGYVLEKYRRLGTYKLIWYKVLYEAKNRGIEYIFAAIQNSNIKSFKVHYKLGMNSNVYKVLYYFRLVWFNVYLIKHFSKFRNIAELKKEISFN